MSEENTEALPSTDGVMELDAYKEYCLLNSAAFLENCMRSFSIISRSSFDTSRVTDLLPFLAAS